MIIDDELVPGKLPEEELKVDGSGIVPKLPPMIDAPLVTVLVVVFGVGDDVPDVVAEVDGEDVVGGVSVVFKRTTVRLRTFTPSSVSDLDENGEKVFFF